jgi:hypothetical protein
MPVHLSTFELPGGARCLREDCVGEMTLEDAHTVLRETGPGGSFEGLPILGLTERITSITAEARGVLGGRGNVSGTEVWAAVVVTNPVIRVAVNFLTRVNKYRKLHLFAREAEAIQWLDEQVRRAATGQGPR